MNYQFFAPLLNALADAAGDAIRPHFRKTGYEDKPDATPVTAADKGAEQAIRHILQKERPDDGIWGEEFGESNMDAEFSWIIDPIDGTKAFIRGMPMFATLIGLKHKNDFVLGVIDQPILRERWLGGVGVPTTLNGTPVKTRACDNLSKAVLNATAPGMFTGKFTANGKRFTPLESSAKYALYGGDAYAYGLLASGFIDVQVDACLKPHDYAALVPVVMAAGGTITDWDGKNLSMHSDGRVIACGDARLHPAALEKLK